MTEETPILKLPYPEPEDAADVPKDMKALAEATEGAILGRGFKMYTPKIINTEESRTNTAFGTMATADEIKSVVLPENGLMLIGYSANFKPSSLGVVAGAAIFLGSNQLKSSGGTPTAQEASSNGTALSKIVTFSGGLGHMSPLEASGADVTTGQALGPKTPDGDLPGGFCPVFAAAGTYNVSVQFKASSGSVTAKERKLWVATLG